MVYPRFAAMAFETMMSRVTVVYGQTALILALIVDPAHVVAGHDAAQEATEHSPGELRIRNEEVDRSTASGAGASTHLGMEVRF